MLELEALGKTFLYLGVEFRVVEGKFVLVVCETEYERTCADSLVCRLAVCCRV